MESHGGDDDDDDPDQGENVYPLHRGGERLHRIDRIKLREVAGEAQLLLTSQLVYTYLLSMMSIS